MLRAIRYLLRTIVATITNTETVRNVIIQVCWNLFDLSYKAYPKRSKYLHSSRTKVRI